MQLWRLAILKSAGWAIKLGELMLQFKTEDSLLQNFLWLCGGQAFGSIQAFD